MVYFLYGQDLAKLNYYLDKIKLENTTAEQITVESAPDKNLLQSTLYTPPMLTGVRLVVFENLKNFASIDFSKIHPKVNVVIVKRSEFKPKFPKFDNLIVIEAKKTLAIFRFLDNLIWAREKENLETILKLLKTEESTFIFYQLITHLRRLILAKSGRFSESLANWQVEKYLKIEKMVSFEKLKTAYKILLATEIEVKTGQKDLAKTLPILILKLTQNFKTT